MNGRKNLTRKQLDALTVEDVEAMDQEDAWHVAVSTLPVLELREGKWCAPSHHMEKLHLAAWHAGGKTISSPLELAGDEGFAEFLRRDVPLFLSTIQTQRGRGRHGRKPRK